MFVINWSEFGSNLREAEEDTIYAWDQFLLAVEGNWPEITGFTDRRTDVNMLALAIIRLVVTVGQK